MAYDPLNNDTIAAIATPYGNAGIGIVRMSGPLSRKIALKVFTPKKPLDNFINRRLYLGHLIEPSSGRMIDEILISFMKAPYSYTGEDVVELNSHSGGILLSKILQIVVDQGARHAEPGEFTFRAFINGRIDLTQAEAIVDLINAKSEKGLEFASHQIKGELREEIESLRQKVIDALARIEVAIDFPEEESDILSKNSMNDLLKRELIIPIEDIISAHVRRKIWMDGVKTVIAGRVNVGKSSLLNRLLNEQRAIVTPVPGTTRDIIESIIYIDGLPFRLIDTAGIRKVRGKVERIGVNLSKQKLKEADLSLILIDQSRVLNDDDIKIINRSQKEKSIIVINKIDLPSKLVNKTLNEISNGIPVVRISALRGDGIQELLQVIRKKVLENDLDTTSSLIPNERQKIALEEAYEHFTNAANNLKEDLPTEIIAVDLKSGLDSLSEITGETANDMIYERIFSKFCIGK